MKLPKAQTGELPRTLFAQEQTATYAWIEILMLKLSCGLFGVINQKMRFVQ